MEKGQVISGCFGDVKVREKAGADIELGELLVAERGDAKILLQVYDLQYGSQISDANLELISGMRLEEQADLDFMEPELRNYKIALLKNLIDIKDGSAVTSKNLPSFFSTVRGVEQDDVSFMTEPDNPYYLGRLRSGTKEVDVDIALDGEDVLQHHVLITGTTGKGKSNLMHTLLWNLNGADYCSTLVLDPHDEYYGRNTTGLRDHPEDVVYYTSQDVPPGGRSLSVHLEVLRPSHFEFMQLSRAQQDALYSYHKRFEEVWISAILDGETAPGVKDVTTSVLRRKLSRVLDIRVGDDSYVCEGVFTRDGGKQTVSSIVDALEDGQTVVVDTSNFSGQVELLVGSLIASNLFHRYKYYKREGLLEEKPVANIVLEEAPRVLGKEVLETGRNVFSTIAREGRKFNVGVTAITQLPSLIPREILANMNTKIIMGTEMNTERQAIIESAAHDLSDDARSIASLDVGEAIVSSNFAQFAIPISIPYFEDMVEEEESDVEQSFDGVM